MRVKSGRNDDQVGAGFLQCRKDAGLERFAKMVAAVIGRQRGIEDIALAGFAQCACARIKRHLVRRAVDHAVVIIEDVLRAIAVVHVPVNDRHPLGAIGLLRVPCRDGRLVEQAEAHGGVFLGMVAGRPGCDKGVVGFLFEHRIDGSDGAADRNQR